MQIKVTFKDVFYVESEEHAYEALLEYLANCITHGDVTAFNFEEMKEGEDIHSLD